MTVVERTGFEMRRELRDGDAEAIVEIHERVYRPEYGMGDRFVEGVRSTVKRMITEAVAEARRLGYKRLDLDTSGALTTAAAIYRSVGFELVSEEKTETWGPRIAYQHYVARLRP